MFVGDLNLREKQSIYGNVGLIISRSRYNVVDKRTFVSIKFLTVCFTYCIAFYFEPGDSDTVGICYYVADTVR